MPCPIRHQGFARLPGQTHDDSARKLRLAIEREEVDLDKMLEEPVRSGSDKKDPLELQTLAYATASFVIEDYWGYVQERLPVPALSTLKTRFAGASHCVRVQCFMVSCLEFLRTMQEQFIDELKERVKDSNPISRRDKIFLCFFLASTDRWPEQKGLHMVSMADLVVIFGRLAEVAPEVFKRDIGRMPSKEEVLGMLKHPSTVHFFVELMGNSREAINPLFAKLEGTGELNLNDVFRVFDSNLFEVVRDNAVYVLRMREEIVSEYRASRDACTGNPARALGCPVLYTGKFREMYDWICATFEDWYA